ncbi:MAG: polysaccharide deacetylase family protein [Micrococcaceae bacterium]|nr:polysaccharide deacetylase family protein [Micrococcaceae bacterium]
MFSRNQLKLLLSVVLLVLAGSGITAPATAAPIADGYYLLKYSGDIYRVSGSGTSIRALTFAEWAAAGYPTPKPAPTDYVKYSWAPTISAVTFFDPAVPSRWLWQPLDYAAWQRAGFPAPRNAGYVGGSYFYQWGTSAEVLVEEPGGVQHVLTPAEWAASGFQPPDMRTNEGFLKLSWSTAIARMSDLSLGKGSAVSYSSWAAQGFPTPRVVPRVTGDQFYRDYASTTIWYAGPTENRSINYAEWQAAGFPDPLVINVPSSYTVPANLRGQDLERIPTTEKVVALTFDAGGSNAGVQSVINTLHRYNVPGSFFATGVFARAYPASIRAMVDGGFVVGNHSNTHPEFPTLTDAQIVAELNAADASIRAAGGRGSRPWFRFPFGARGPLDIAVVNGAGFVPFRWTVDTLGWQGTSGGRSAISVRDRALAAATPGEIILMHVGANPDDGTTLDADALPSIIEGLQARGYSFVSLNSVVP